jgi:hypothetical protein
MQEANAYQELLDSLMAATGMVGLEAGSPLQRDVVALWNQPHRSNFRIAVFAPFNYGKSTLLNAILGQRALPIDLIPTTGAAINLRYGETLQTRIQFRDGRELQEAGTEILQQYAILDDQRRMREDVAAVEVLCPHPWLKTGVELVDLPGTDDREAQDELVRDQLLSADLIVQVLDGRKLMTLGEREHLRDWLGDRGIDTVVFVVNFLNLMSVEEQKQVCNRLRFVAESFRSQLPAGVSNLYRVDALPALRARVKGDMAAAQMTGLPLFESALATIVEAQQAQTTPKLARVHTIAMQVKQALQTKIATLTTELSTVESKREQKAQIQQQAVELLRQGFARSVADFSGWLAVPNLLNRYQYPLAMALLNGNVRDWVSGEFKTTAIDHQQAVAKWVHQACEFFDRPRPNQLLVAFPPDPQVSLPDPTSPASSGKSPDLAPTAVATGIGWVLGGPVGGAILGGASYLLNKTLDPGKPAAAPPPSVSQLNYLYMEAARTYLVDFSGLNLTALQRYETIADRVIQFQPNPDAAPVTPQHHQVRLLQTTLDRLEAAMRAL